MISTCQTCKKSFRNTKVSPWCDDCNTEMDAAWADHQNHSNDESSTTEKKRTDFGVKIQISELKLKPEEKLTTKQTPSDTELKTENIIMPIKKNEIKAEPNGDAEIGRDNLNTKELTIVPTPSTSNQSSTLPEISETQREEFMANSVNLKTEISHSINLLSQSEQELFASMKGLRAHQPETTIRLYDPERVQTAVMCARQIAESMKTKIELMKFSNKLSRKISVQP